jgi:hypothetical protein
LRVIQQDAERGGAVYERGKVIVRVHCG